MPNDLPGVPMDFKTPKLLSQPRYSSVRNVTTVSAIGASPHLWQDTSELSAIIRRLPVF